MGPNRFRLLDRPHLGMALFPQREQDSALPWCRIEDRLNHLDRFFWITLRYIWPRWSDVLLIVKPETVADPR
jgi:hypothetical protein